MLDEENVLVKTFRMVKEKINQENPSNVSLRLLGKRSRDGRTYSLSEIVVLVVGDFDKALSDRDIIVEKRSGRLQRINELHPSYLALQYPLLFAYGEDQYSEKIGFSGSGTSSGNRKRVSPKEFFAYRLHDRVNECSVLLYSRRLFQQFVVDAYTMVETGRLLFVRTQQKKLRAEMYSGLAEPVLRGDTDGSMHGKRIILPSSFVGGARYMIQNYQDALAICRWIGYPSLFITFTCNPKWPEIVRFLSVRGLKSDDRPDIVCRIFKVKWDSFVRDLKTKKNIWSCESSNEDKQPRPQRIDEIISAEIPDPVTDPCYYENVKERRDGGLVIMKDGVPLDNRYIVPHNRALLMKYGGHVNVEWCNQSRSFKYISSCEAAWRILGFEIQYKDPSVERLSFHLPNEQSSKFLGWMDANKIYSEGRGLTYGEFPTKFVWKTDHWQPRKQRFSIGRLFYVAPDSGDIYYLRCLLNIVKGATSYEDIKRVNGVQYDTFRDACFALGLLDDDKEYVDGITEASFWSSVHSIRLLFRKLRSIPGLLLSDEDVQNFALAEIEKLLLNVGKSLRDFQALGREHLDFLSKFTDEQLHVHDTIMSSVYSNGGGMFFVYGYGGTGKTFIWRSLSAGIRSRGEIVLNVASSGIASLLLPGGRTTHSRFKIPINVDEDSMCNIKPGSALAELIVKAKLIIWDEAPTIHKHCIEAVDRTFRDIMRVSDECSVQKPFGGKTIVFCGDFRQILPVVPKVLYGSEAYKKYETAEGILKEFSSWVSSIGDGVLGGPNDGEVTIGFPSDIVLSNSGDPLKTIVSKIYPSYMNHEELSGCLRDRAILAPTLEIVDEVNQFMMSLDQSEGRLYLSSDNIANSDSTSDGLADIHSVEFLNN
ncbi:uncharacterized protein LOC121749372 [Salvia splendens]|uniref:uncharacterized protein LOC121749372 n=1 Tax=Salvia splendens TaxID=180675 RepID=UPI001C267AFE|nr:uncharacterized protein LOC121749372 [Salvia splendens]